MLCPGCGKEINPSQKFCEFCGVPTNSAPKQGIVSNDTQQQVAQISYDNMDTYNNNNQTVAENSFSAPQNTYQNSIPQNTYQNSVPQNNQFAYDPQMQNQYAPPANNGYQQQTYNGTMPITNGDVSGLYQNNYSATAETAKKKPFFTPKKFIIIAVIALLVAIIGIMAFFFIRRKIERDYIVNNPTKSTLNSYQKYMEENNSDDPLFKILKNADNTGNLKVTADVKVPVDGQEQTMSGNVNLAYDRKQGKYYLRLDAGDLLKMASAGSSQAQESSKGIVEISQSPQNLYFNYDLFGTTGKYIVDNTNFRQAINDSIFSPDKDNVLNIEDKEQFDKFIDVYEKAVTELSNPRVDNDDPTDLEKTYENLIKIAEKNGNVTVEDGTAVVNNGKEDKSIDADIITYSYDYNSFKQMITEFKDEIKAYIGKSIEDADEADNSKNSIEESFNSFIESYSNGAGENFTLVVKVYLDRNNHSMVKTTLEMNNYTKDGGKSFANFDFLKAPDNMIRFNITAEQNGNKNTADAVLAKTDDGTTVKYTFTMNSNSVSNQVTADASFEYNRSTKQFTLSANSSDAEEPFTYTGSAEITDKKIALTLNDVVKTDEVSISLKIDFSSDPPPAVDTSDAKDFLKISKEEFENLFSGVGSAAAPFSNPGGLEIDDDYDPYETSWDDYSQSSDDDNSYGDYSQSSDDDYSYEDSKTKSMQDAVIVDSALKTFYAGVTAGTINSKTNPEISSLPAPTATVSERKEAAKNATIEDALKYAGLEDMKNEIYMLNVDPDGNIYSFYDESYRDVVGSMIFSSMTLREIYPDAR